MSRSFFFSLLVDSLASPPVTPPPGPQQPLYPPAGWTGVVSSDTRGGLVTSAYDAPQRRYVQPGQWVKSGYGGGMYYKEYGTPQDGSVYYEIDIWAVLDCFVDFYVLVDGNDASDFQILRNGSFLGAGNSAGDSSSTPQARCTVTIPQGANTIRFTVRDGITIYVSKIVITT